MDLTIKKEMLDEIREILSSAKNNISNAVNNELVIAYWNIGRVIVENEQAGSDKAGYGDKTLLELSKALTKEFGKGFSRSNVYTMRQFYLKYPKIQTVAGKLSWSHYSELLLISDDEKRAFYEKEAISNKWSKRELKRQINTSLFERLLLSKDNLSRKEVIELSKKGQEITKPEDIIKDPYVFEFLDIPENKPILESDLEKALVAHIEKFLLELGKGFMFVGTQQRVTVGNEHYYVDMVFYNKILHCYILIELKTKKLMPSAAGQLNMYLNYYKTEINEDGDNDPIGIIMCTDKDNVSVEYSLGGYENKIFASKYTLVLPNKEKLIEQVNKVIDDFNKKNN